MYSFPHSSQRAENRVSINAFSVQAPVLCSLPRLLAAEVRVVQSHWFVKQVTGQTGGYAMHVEYDVTEQDFLYALQLVHRRTSARLVRWMELVTPFMGFALLIFLFHRLATQGISVLFVLGLALGLYLLFLPKLGKRRQHQLYRNSEQLHGKLFLDVDDKGIRFGGQMGALEINWTSFGGCVEGRQMFIVFPKKGRTFQIVPKRCLSVSAIEEFRKCLKRFLGKID